MLRTSPRQNELAKRWIPSRHNVGKSGNENVQIDTWEHQVIEHLAIPSMRKVTTYQLVTPTPDTSLIHLHTQFYRPLELFILIIHDDPPLFFSLVLRFQKSLLLDVLQDNLLFRLSWFIFSRRSCTWKVLFVVSARCPWSKRCDCCAPDDSMVSNLLDICPDL